MLLPDAIIPKTKTKLIVAKIRGITSYGMLCSESELNLSDESDGIIELCSKSKYEKSNWKELFFKIKSNLKLIYQLPLIDQTVLVFRGIARDLAASGFGKLKDSKEKKIKSKIKQSLKVKIN